MSRRRRSRTREQRSEGLDEAAGLSGWLYTDLLLGLFIVFIGAVAFTPVLFASGEDEGSPTPGSTTIPAGPTTTTTSTLPPELCTRLLTPPADRNANSVFVEKEWSGETLRNEFTAQLFTLIEEINKRPSTEIAIDPENLRIGMILASGGGSDTSLGKIQADAMEVRLKELFAGDLLETTVFRNGGSVEVRSAEVRLEVFPLIEAPC